MARQRLTPEEVSAVNLVTKGESYSHRHWPEDVVRAFASATVVTAGAWQRQAADRTRPAIAHLTRLVGHG